MLQVSLEVSPFTACQEERLEVFLLCEGWTSRAGGLSTLNRELTVHLAGAGMVRSDPEDFRLEGYDIAAKAFACSKLREDQLLVKEFVESR